MMLVQPLKYSIHNEFVINSLYNEVLHISKGANLVIIEPAQGIHQ